MKPPGTVQRARTAVARWLLSFGSRGAGRLPVGALRSLAGRSLNERRIRHRTMVSRVSDDVAVCRVLGRYKMFVDPGDHGHAVHLIFDGYWEIEATQAVASLVRPGMTAVDVGANQGYYTLLLAGLVGRKGQVHAVEPNGRMLGLLRRSVMVNGLTGLVHCHERALGADEVGQFRLCVPEGSPSGAWLVSADGEEGAIRTTTLDALLGDSPVDFVKIDAEGAERAIWAGMAGIRARAAPLTIMMEFVRDRTPDAAAFLGEFAAEGFSLATVDKARGLRPTTPAEVLATPSGREWMLVLRR